MPHDQLTVDDLTARGHSYRGFEPMDVLDAAENDGQSEARWFLTEFHESGRFGPFLDETSRFFSKLDRDEQEMFTKRNPGLVRWVSVYNRLQDLNPYGEFFESGGQMLSGNGVDMSRVPKFEVDTLGGRGLLEDMMRRRRSYRNWAPQEFEQLMADDEMEITRGQAREIGYRTPEARTELEFPRDVNSKEVVRNLLDRVEAGRMASMANDGMTFFSRLDVDERRLFADRNPGIVMWISAWGESNHLIHGDQLQVDYPTLGTAENVSLDDF